MQDLGIQPRTIDAARAFADAARKGTAVPRNLVTLADALVTSAHDQGNDAPDTATAADRMYLALRELDLDQDGQLTAEEAPSASYAAGLYRALQTNDRAGDEPMHAGDPRAWSSLSMPAQKPGVAPAPVLPVAPFFPNAFRVVVLTCWSSRGARYAFERARPQIDRVRPDAVMLHTDPIALAHGGADLNKYVRSLYPSMGILWAVYGDAYGPDPTSVMVNCAKAAEKDGVASLMEDAEASWKRPFRGATVQDRVYVAKRVMNAMRQSAPTLHLSFTSYDGPINIVRPDGQGRWGGHESFPWAGFLGPGTPTNAEAPQVYNARVPPTPPATYDQAKNRYFRALKSRDAAIRRGWIRADVERWIYSQVHGCSAASITGLADTQRVLCGWAAPSILDEEGIRGLANAAKLGRLRMTTGDFQAAHKLDVDSRIGAKTQALLDEAPDPVGT